MAYKNFQIYTGLIFAIFIVSIYYYFPFSAEDSYIVARYAHNFVFNGILAYNIEEPISALTSPLHAILESFVLYIFRAYDPVILWKFISIICFLLSIILLSRLLKTVSQKLFFYIMTFLSSSIILWIVGGLETILLMLLISIVSYLVMADKIHSLKELLFFGAISGLCVITRYDAIIFLFPIYVYIFIIQISNSLIIASKKDNMYKYILSVEIKKHGKVKFFYSFIVMVGIFFTWSLISYRTYGHILPTSFFQKTPEYSFPNFFATIRGLIWTGVLPLVIYFLIKRDKNRLYPNQIVLFLSLCCILLYLFSMANTHMMFSFRAFLPYLPISVVLLLSFKKNISKIILVAFFMFQSIGLVATYNYGINYPLSYKIESSLFDKNTIKYLGQEYAILDIPTYIKFMNILKEQALKIEKDWKKYENKIIPIVIDDMFIPIKNPHRKPTIMTYAEGIASYVGIDMFFSGWLVTRGKCKMPDYIMLLSEKYLEKAFIVDKLKFYTHPKYNSNLFLSVFRIGDLNQKWKNNIKKRTKECQKIKLF